MSNFTIPEDEEFELDNPRDSSSPTGAGNIQSGAQRVIRQQAQATYEHQRLSQTTSQEMAAQSDEEEYPEWQPAAKIESKFNHGELSSIKGSKQASSLSGGRSQDSKRISISSSGSSGVVTPNQTDSTKLGRETVSAIRALAEAQQQSEAKPESEGFLSKLKKLLKMP